MGSVPDPKLGDWLIHEAIWPYGARWGRLAVGPKRMKRAEVADVTRSWVVLYLEGESGAQPVARADITRWWSPFAPPVAPNDIPPPEWVAKSVECRTGKFRATISTINGRWVSLIEWCNDFHDVLRLMPCSEFVKAGWERTKLPPKSVWQRLRDNPFK